MGKFSGNPIKFDGNLTHGFPVKIFPTKPLHWITSLGEIPPFSPWDPGPPGPQGGAPDAGSGRRADRRRRAEPAAAARAAARAAAGADAEGGGVSARWGSLVNWLVKNG